MKSYCSVIYCLQTKHVIGCFRIC
uniref:Uncharacterized protein n=1 Tax=Tetranychus urticae TaxID=32264 RepID=T1KIA4_TETUR